MSRAKVREQSGSEASETPTRPSLVGRDVRRGRRGVADLLPDRRRPLHRARQETQRKEARARPRACPRRGSSKHEQHSELPPLCDEQKVRKQSCSAPAGGPTHACGCASVLLVDRAVDAAQERLEEVVGVAGAL